MAAKSSTYYLCSECGWSGSKWYGRCPECGEWGTLSEFSEPKLQSGVSKALRSSRNSRSAKANAIAALNIDSSVDAQPISSIQADNGIRIHTGFSEFDRVLGGGLVPGSVTLIAGEPGIGKSTLLLETAGKVAKNGGESTQSNESATNLVLYISGEESKSQVKLRASRINAISQNLLLASTTDLNTALALIEKYKPTLAIVDSAQTIVSSDVDGITGGSTQVREVASALIDVAKTCNIPVLLVGHVTKDGSIAGPRTLEHLVDTVCQFEGDSQTALRMLRAVKNRFGPTDEVGCFDMSGCGIEEVPDPSGLFLSSNEDCKNEGTCVTLTLEGNRSLAIEVQALVTDSVLPAPRRAVSGVDANRIAMLTAVLYRHGGLNLLAKDIYVSTIAGAKAKEPSCDLAIVASLASAAKNKPVLPFTCAIGEISLTGQVRSASRMETRLKEAARIGYKRAIVCHLQKKIHVAGIDVVEVNNLKEALKALGL
ncbi:DNA repair protein RadA [Gardnerella pickettii]|uniref:DNA repair protein RadA n=1 Tax=Gardnerella pickettii JCP7719 TaxID=1261061 RepID=S4GW18_9BIFI|nr:DNA repair protein RadA [Gardnerella pickettii]EIK84587.1 DNA repair protein RadA [Gardnerella pickettii 00703C2mash]EPI51002.1 DNA repair protein RadA [Gardnerella pickettii JCP7719]